MNVIDRIRTFAGFEASPQIETKVITINDIPHYPPSNKARVFASPEAVQNIDTVFACTRAIAEPIGTLGVDVVKTKNKAIVPNPYHQIQKLLVTPNSYQTWNEFMERAMYHTVQQGEHFAHIFRDRDGVPRELHLVHPVYISDYTYDRDLNMMWWRVSIGGDSNDPYHFSGVVPDYDMIHVPILNETIRGRSVIRKYMEDFAHSIAVRDYGSEFFGKSGNPAIWVETVEPSITPEQNVEFSAHMRGQRHGNILLPYGRKIHQLSVSPNEAQFLQTRYINVETICRIFNVPPPVVQHFKDGSNYSNLETINRYYASATLHPYTSKCEAEYTNKLFTKAEKDRGYHIRFDYSTLLKADPKTRAEVDAKYVQNAIKTVNEVRAVDGLAPMENGDRLLIQQNMAFLDKLDELYASKYGKNGNNTNNGNGGSNPPGGDSTTDPEDGTED